jgi:hypothetical protein
LLIAFSFLPFDFPEIATPSARNDNKWGPAMTGQGWQRGIVVILEGNRKKFCYNDITSKILKRDRQNQKQAGNGDDLNGRQVC